MPRTVVNSVSLPSLRTEEMDEKIFFHENWTVYNNKNNERVTLD